MKFLLNISTHGSDRELIGDDWSVVQTFLRDEGFDGFELYPVQGYPFEKIPSGIIHGIHLRFFIIIEPIWNGNRARLLDIFGDEATILHFYGGSGREALIETYRWQLELAERLGCDYVVFHPTHCELEYIYDWKFPWTWQSTVDLSADIMNEVMRETPFRGRLLFENLWWPGNFRLDHPEEIERLLGRMDYPNCGIVLDTGHLLNKNQCIRTESEGIAYLLQTVENLGTLKSTILAVHLTRSLSAEYVNAAKSLQDPYKGSQNFWERLAIARQHVQQIDTHDAFESREIARLFESIEPEHVVFEFSFCNLSQWRTKVRAQKCALGEVFHNRSCKDLPSSI